MSEKREKQQKGLPFDRRDFLKIGGAATAGFLARGLAAPPALAGLPETPPLPENPATPKAMPTRNLGKTGYQVGIFSLGGQAAVERPDNEEQAVAIVERALDLGVNYIDTAHVYGRGISQRYIGQVMKRRRKEVFLATKTRDRGRDGSFRQLDQSLESLQTDHLDLWQIHNLSRMEEVDEIFAPGGAMEALIEAREKKIVRYLGISGHADPDVLIEAIRRFPFDAILLALNAADPHQRPFRTRLLPLAVEREMGIIGMKVPARGRILSSWSPGGPGGGWGGGDRPGTVTMKEALYYTLSHPVSTVIIGVDSIAQLEENVELARRFTPLNDAQLAELHARTEPVARQSLFFRRWA
jgi:uncharacterized protein